VAVKVVKKENAEDALKEVETMTAFNHQNILRMIGIAKNESKRLNLLVPLN
jgi:ribulose bisphosphate carboxylase small subunit